MADFLTYRRYCLYKRMSANLLCNQATAAVWQSKQEAEPGTTLPSGFPKKTELAAVGYVADEDLNGADCDELVDYARISRRDAQAVLTAYAAL